jgi:uncharacterized protein (DUF3084 family)
MTFSDFFYLVILLGKGDKQLGFCNCASCNQGYRELLAAMTNATEKKNLTAQSREIVIKSREEKIDGFKIDFSKFLKVLTEKKNKETEKATAEITEARNGKIIIELDYQVLENAVINVLKSEKVQKIVQSIPRKKGRPKKL